MFHARSSLKFSLFMILFSLQAIGQQNSVFDKNTLGEIKARSIGPATMSGRIACLDAVQKNPGIIYVGAASGGVWKSINGGTTFKAVFDEYNPSIGTITIDQDHPDTVWVGTGETWVRNSVSVGDGVYKTTDGGKTWKKMGLENSERIAKIIISPTNPDHIYVAALGTLWAPNHERGVFKTEDGGKTWQQVFYVDENTGCSDLAIDFNNPEIIYAGMWNFRRYPYMFHSGGESGGLFKSTDGGKTWSKLAKDLPSGQIGRVSVVVSPVKSNLVWALIETKNTALYRSDDYGETWKMMNDSRVVSERPFYFSLLIPDTRDTNRLYKPGYTLNVSDDGGKSFTYPFVSGGNFHSDLHALWISKADNRLLYLGTDGGLYVSKDKGNTWNYCRNLPISQFYHAQPDDNDPYFVYGGLQDNGSWTGPSRSPGGINFCDWDNVGFGDGFNVFRDIVDKNIVYWQYQGGQIKRMYKDTREVKDIIPYPEKGTDKLRFNWNTPLYQGKSGRLYVGAQYLYASRDMGDTWERISGDLTTNDPAKLKQEETGGLTIDNSSAENHCTIFTISESPVNRNIIWAGTDDGNIQVTVDGGKSWNNTVSNITGLPKSTWCSSVSGSFFEEASAFATFDGHRYGDMSVYVYKTSDYGKTWISIADTNIKGYCHNIRQDLINPDLLFLGTESGLFISLNAGQNWVRFSGDFPKVPVNEISYQEMEHDIIVATHGRGIYIIDDITPLQSLKTESLNEEVVFLPSRPYVIRSMGGAQTFNGDDEFIGSNPSDVVNITYYLKKRHLIGDMYLEIYDNVGKLIKKLPAGTRKGINRIQWNMIMKPPKVPSSVQMLGQAFTGPTYPPGKYEIRIVKGDKIYKGSIDVIFDPKSRHSFADRDQRLQTIMMSYNLLEELAFCSNQLKEIFTQSNNLVSTNLSKKLKTEIQNEANKADILLKELSPSKEGDITGEERFREKLAAIYGGVMGYSGKPTNSQLERLSDLQVQVEDYKTRTGSLVTYCTQVLNPKLEKSGLKIYTFTSREVFFKE